MRPITISTSYFKLHPGSTSYVQISRSDQESKEPLASSSAIFEYPKKQTRDGQECLSPGMFPTVCSDVSPGDGPSSRVVHLKTRRASHNRARCRLHGIMKLDPILRSRMDSHLVLPVIFGKDFG